MNEEKTYTRCASLGPVGQTGSMKDDENAKFGIKEFNNITNVRNGLIQSRLFNNEECAAIDEHMTALHNIVRRLFDPPKNETPTTAMGKEDYEPKCKLHAPSRYHLAELFEEIKRGRPAADQHYLDRLISEMETPNPDNLIGAIKAIIHRCVELGIEIKWYDDTEGKAGSYSSVSKKINISLQESPAEMYRQLVEYVGAVTEYFAPKIFGEEMKNYYQQLKQQTPPTP